MRLWQAFPCRSGGAAPSSGWQQVSHTVNSALPRGTWDFLVVQFGSRIAIGHWSGTYSSSISIYYDCAMQQLWWSCSRAPQACWWVTPVYKTSLWIFDFLLMSSLLTSDPSFVSHTSCFIREGVEWPRMISGAATRKLLQRKDSWQLFRWFRPLPERSEPWGFSNNADNPIMPLSLLSSICMQEWKRSVNNIINIFMACSKVQSKLYD